MLDNLSIKMNMYRWKVRLPFDLSDDVTACIHALEGGIYLLELNSESEQAFIQNRFTGSVQKFGSLACAKRCAKDLGLTRMSLSLETPYDQMIGLRPYAQSN